jgi:hypothetical protein
MKMVIAFGATLAMGGVAYAAPSCQNQALACRIDNAAFQLEEAAQEARHFELASATGFLTFIADDFCHCDFSRFQPGSGVLINQFHNVEGEFDRLGGQVTENEAAAFGNLRRQVGQ